jgi:hypothetical protein
VSDSISSVELPASGVGRGQGAARAACCMARPTIIFQSSERVSQSVSHGLNVQREIRAALPAAARRPRSGRRADKDVASSQSDDPTKSLTGNRPVISRPFRSVFFNFAARAALSRPETGTCAPAPPGVFEPLADRTEHPCRIWKLAGNRFQLE